MSVGMNNLTAHDAMRRLTPLWAHRDDPAIGKLEQAALETFEFYRDLIRIEKKVDQSVLVRCARDLRLIWDRE